MVRVTLILSVDSMCLVETDKTVKEVWSKVNQECKSERDTCLISERSFSNFEGDLKPVVVFPLKNITEE